MTAADLEGSAPVAGRIDIHAHLPIGSMRGSYARGPATGADRFPTVEWSAQAAIEAMERHGIQTQLLSLPHMFTSTTAGTAEAAGSARGLNERFASIVGGNPQRFGAFATLPADTPDGALTELEYALDVLGLDGVAVTTNTKGRYLGHSFFEPVPAELERRQTPLFIHPANPPYTDHPVSERPNFLLEFPFETCRTVTDAIYAGVFRRHPNLVVIVAHCGGALPALAWRISSLCDIGRAPADLDVSAAEVIETLGTIYYDTALSGTPTAVLPTIAIAGSDHILYGTDSGAAADDIISLNASGLLALGLGANQAKIDRHNAARLFPRLTS